MCWPFRGISFRSQDSVSTIYAVDLGRVSPIVFRIRGNHRIVCRSHCTYFLKLQLVSRKLTFALCGMCIIDKRKMSVTLALSRSGRLPGNNSRANPNEKPLFVRAKRPFRKFVGALVSKLPKTLQWEFFNKPDGFR